MDRIWGLNEAFGDYATDTYWPGVIGETGYFGLVVILALFIMII